MVTCYLDSQDYSVLTDPKLDTLAHRQIKDALLNLARSKQVRFVFSSAVISEMAPLRSDTAHLAERKAEFLSDLCGLNALVSFDRLVLSEASALALKAGPPQDVFDLGGRWFPEIPLDETPHQPWVWMLECAEDEMKAIGLSRQERRAKSRTFIKNGKPRQALCKYLAQLDPRAVSAALLQAYPMHPNYAETMGKYALGQATEKDFNEALMNSLKDPRWVVKWFATEHAMSSQMADVVRKPGRELGQLMRTLAVEASRLAKILQDAGNEDPTGKRGEVASRWKDIVDRQLLALPQSVASKGGIELGEFNVGDVSECCPGIAAGVRSLFSSVWANVGEGRKDEPSDSQPVDALHAFYAPYVDVFRADRFMAPHIQEHVKATGTIVVSRLSMLVGVLQQQLR